MGAPGRKNNNYGNREAITSDAGNHNLARTSMKKLETNTRINVVVTFIKHDHNIISERVLFIKKCINKNKN